MLTAYSFITLRIFCGSNVFHSNKAIGRWLLWFEHLFCWRRNHLEPENNQHGSVHLLNHSIAMLFTFDNYLQSIRIQLVDNWSDWYFFRLFFSASFRSPFLFDVRCASSALRSVCARYTFFWFDWCVECAVCVCVRALKVSYKMVHNHIAFVVPFALIALVEWTRGKWENVAHAFCHSINGHRNGMAKDNKLCGMEALKGN